MSHTNNFRYSNSRGRIDSSNNLQANSIICSQSRTPVIYSQPFVMRQKTDLSESEPISEYEFSEMPLSLRREIPTPSIQFSGNRREGTQPQQKIFRANCSPSPYARPSHLLPLPTPQHYVAQNDSDQSFVMQPKPSPSTSRQNSLEANKSPRVAKSNGKSMTGKSQGIKMTSVNRKRFFVGSIEQVIRWHKMAKETQLHAIYEIPAVVESLQSSSKVYRMVLRNEQNNKGLPLQAVFYPIDRELPKIKTGDLITCVGRMVGANKFQVYNLWHTAAESLAGLKRISFLCQRALQEVHHNNVSEP